MVRELPAGEPVLPVMRRPDQPCVRIRVIGRRFLATPRQSDVAQVALLEECANGRLTALEAEPHVRRQRHLDVGALRGRDALVVAVAGMRPADPCPPVVEHGLAVHHRLHLAGDATDRSQQDVLGVVVVRGAAVGLRALAVVPPRPHEEHVADDDPAGRRAPARLQDHRAGEIPAVGGHAHVGRSDPERARMPAEDLPEHTRSVEPRQAHPVDRAVGRHERRHLTVAQEAVVTDRDGTVQAGVRGVMRAMVAGLVVLALPRRGGHDRSIPPHVNGGKGPRRRSRVGAAAKPVPAGTGSSARRCIDSAKPLTRRYLAELPQGRKAARAGELYRVREGSFRLDATVGGPG